MRADADFDKGPTGAIDRYLHVHLGTLTPVQQVIAGTAIAELDTMDGLSTEMQELLQDDIDKRAQAEAMISNILKKTQETQDAALTQNMKG